MLYYIILLYYQKKSFHPTRLLEMSNFLNKMSKCIFYNSIWAFIITVSIAMYNISFI